MSQTLVIEAPNRVVPPPHLDAQVRRRPLDVAILALLAGVAFWLTWAAGQRGFMPWDQGFVFDGGYRLLIGQVPYRDFVVPFGLTAFAIQALFFKILGVHYGAMIAAAAFYCKKLSDPLKLAADSGLYFA